MKTHVSFRRASVAAMALVILSAQAQPSAKEIVDRVDRILRGRSSHGVAEMRVETEHWTRTLGMEIWSLGTEYALVRITAPQKEAGTATLKADDQIWNYLPRVDRTIKIPPSLMMGAWMGSHFTNDDLVKESRMAEDYEVEIGYEGERDGEEIWEFVLTPKPEAAVVWGKVTMQVRKRDLMPVWVRYFDESDELVRQLDFSEYSEMGGRLVPAHMEMQPLDKPDERTVLDYKSLEFNIDIDESFFSLRNLRSRGS